MAKYFTLLLLTIPESVDHGIEAQSLVYAVIDEVKILDHTNIYGRFYKGTGHIVFVDLNQVKCIIGRVLD